MLAAACNCWATYDVGGRTGDAGVGGSSDSVSNGYGRGIVKLGCG